MLRGREVVDIDERPSASECYLSGHGAEDERLYLAYKARCEQNRRRRNLAEALHEQIYALDKGLDTCHPSQFEDIMREINLRYDRIEKLYE